MTSNIDKDKIARDITSLLQKARQEADPQLLSEYRGIFKKNVSFFDRSLTAAYLLMLYEQGGGRPRPQRGGNRDGGGSRDNDRGRGYQRQDSAPQDEPRAYPLAEEESTRLFMSIGRSRRIYPREILGMITNRCGVAREDVGAIRILDNYSFVQVRTTAAAGIIDALNGVDFRGRPMTVNYARSRREEPAGEAEAEAGEAPEAAAESAGGGPESAESWAGRTDTANDSLSGSPAGDSYQGDDEADKDGVRRDSEQQ